MRSARTNEETSMSRRPAATSALTNATFASAGTGLASFWRPSRGPTSVTRTRAGKGLTRDLRGWSRSIRDLRSASASGAPVAIGSSSFEGATDRADAVDGAPPPRSVPFLLAHPLTMDDLGSAWSALLVLLVLAPAVLRVLVVLVV